MSDLPLQPEHLAFAGAGPLCAACEHEEGAADDGDDCDDGSLGSLAGRDEQDAEEQMRAAAPRDPRRRQILAIIHRTRRFCPPWAGRRGVPARPRPSLPYDPAPANARGRPALSFSVSLVVRYTLLTLHVSSTGTGVL